MVGLWCCNFPFTSLFISVENRANKHLGEDSWGQVEEGIMCPGRYQGRGSVWGCNALPAQRNSGRSHLLLVAKVSLHQCYRATQIKPNPFQWAFHMERSQQKSSGVCLRKLFQGLHRFLHIYAQTWCRSTTHASLLLKMKSALGKKKHSVTSANIQPSAKHARVDTLEQRSNVGSCRLWAAAAAPASAWSQPGQVDTCLGGAAPQQLRFGKKSKGKTSWHGQAYSV